MCFKNGFGVECAVEPKSYNVLDTDWVDARDKTVGGRIDKMDEAGRRVVPDFRRMPLVPPPALKPS